MTDEWEDIAYGPSISSGGSDDGWEDIAIGAPLTQPKAAPLGGGETFAGGIGNLLNAMTFGFGDEAVSGVNAGIDALMGSNLSDAYDARLSQVRDLNSRYRQEHPVASIGTDIAAAVKMPLAPLIGKVASIPAKIGILAGEGAAYGGLNAFGSGEGGTGQRLQDLLKGAETGAVIGGGLGAAGQLISKVANRYAEKLPVSAQEVLEKGLGIQYGDRTKGLNRVNLFVDEAGNTVPYDDIAEAVGVQAPIQQQVKTLQEAGIFKNAPDDIQSLKIYLTKEEAKIGKTIPLLVNKADEILGSTEILPEFKATSKFLEGYRPETRNKLTSDFNKIIDDYIDAPGSGLKKLTKFTDQLQKETKFDSAVPAEITQLKRMIQYDMRKAAEQQFDEAVPEMAGAFTKANEIVTASKNISKTLNKPLARKMPSFGDYIKGGSLPMTAMTGALSLPFGLGPAAILTGGKLATNALKEYSEAARPISTSKLYELLAGKADKLSKEVTNTEGVTRSLLSILQGGSGSTPTEQDLSLLKSADPQASLSKLTPQSAFVSPLTEDQLLEGETQAQQTDILPSKLSSQKSGDKAQTQKSNTQISRLLNATSFNSTLDKALTQAEKQMDLKTQQVVEINKTSSKVPSDSFIEKEEGGQQLKAYPPPAKGSGITVGTGVDLGQHSEKDLEEMGVSDKTIYKVRKYLGKKDAIARAALKEKPLELTKEEADELDAAVHGDIYGTVEDKLKAKGVTLAKLPEEAQTVIKSIAINFGKNFDEKIPSIWKAITEKDWSKVQDLLVNTKWKQPELVARRKREADLLSRIV